MTSTRREKGISRPARTSVVPASTWGPLPGRRIVALLREIRERGWLAVLDRIAHSSSLLPPPSSRGAGRRTPSRTFYPTVDGRLEGRMLLTKWHVVPKVLANSAFLLKHPSARAAFLKNFPPQVQNQPVVRYHVGQITRRRLVIATQTARGGQAVEVTALDGSHYKIMLSYTSNTIATANAEGANGQTGNSSPTSTSSQVAVQNATYPQPIGTVRAYAMSGGRVGLIVDGSTQNTELTINPLGQRQYKGFAHSFAYGEAARRHTLNIGQLTVTSGEIGAIEGFQTASLSGPLTVPGTVPVNRIAFSAILPGASITTGSDLQTLDVLNNIDLSGPGTGIHVGRDLNLLNVGNGITLSDGANFLIGRNLGLVSQPPKGTGTGANVLSLNFTNVNNSIITITIPSIGSFIQGSVAINPGSVFGIGGMIYNTMYVEGSVSGYSRLIEQAGTAAQHNPPFLTSLSFATSASPTPTPTPTPVPAPTPAGPAPAGYLTALQGVTP